MLSARCALTVAGTLLLALLPATVQADDMYSSTAVNYPAQPTDVPSIVAEEAAQDGIPPATALCVARKESGFNPASAGYYVGLYQLGPGELNGFYRQGFTDWADPRQATHYFALRIRQGAGTGTWPTLAGCM